MSISDIDLSVSTKSDLFCSVTVKFLFNTPYKNLKRREKRYVVTTHLHKLDILSKCLLSCQTEFLYFVYLNQYDSAM